MMATQQGSHTTSVSLPHPRLRASCNSCGLAKVRCTREQPSCGRCTAMSLTCVYGVSRWAGKAQRKRPSVTERQQLPHERRTGHSPFAAASGLRNISAATSRAQTEAMPLQPVDFAEFSGLNSLAQLDLPNTPMPLVGDAYGVVDSQIAASSFEHPYPWSPDPGHAIADSDFNHADHPSTFTPSTDERHDCSAESYRILGSLTMTPSPSETILTRLDQVLQSSRQAIDGLTKILTRACPCFKAPYLIMLHATIISRTLNWYQQAAGFACRIPLSASISDSASPGTTASEDTFSQRTPEGSEAPLRLSLESSDDVTQLPFSLGRFNIEEPCVQFAFRNLLIGHELKRVGSLIDLFASVDVQDANELRSNLTAWLRTEHASSTRELRSAIKKLNSNIDL